MAELTATNIQSSGARAVVINTLTASDTFVYRRGAVMVVKNATAGALTPNIDGDAGSTVPVRGAVPLDVSGGYTFPSIAAGATVAVSLDTISAYLQGTITMTGGAGCEVALLNLL